MLLDGFCLFVNWVSPILTSKKMVFNSNHAHRWRLALVNLKTFWQPMIEMYWRFELPVISCFHISCRIAILQKSFIKLKKGGQQHGCRHIETLWVPQKPRLMKIHEWWDSHGFPFSGRCILYVVYVLTNFIFVSSSLCLMCVYTNPYNRGLYCDP